MGRLSAYAKNRILKLRFKKNKRIIHIVEILKRDDNIKVSRQAVSTFLKKYLETNSIYDKPRTGRKRKLTQEEIQLIGQVTRLNRDITARAIKEYLNLNVSTYTILRATKLFEWNKVNPNSNDSKKAAVRNGKKAATAEEDVDEEDDDDEDELDDDEDEEDEEGRGESFNEENDEECPLLTTCESVEMNNATGTAYLDANGDLSVSVTTDKKTPMVSNESSSKPKKSGQKSTTPNRLARKSNKRKRAMSSELDASNENDENGEVEKIQLKPLVDQELKKNISLGGKSQNHAPVKTRHSVNSIPDFEKVDLNLMPHNELIVLKNLSCSPMSFATKILFKIFKIDELHGHNVSGKTLNKNLKAKLPLDPLRVGYIKFLVEKYYDEKECKEMLCGATSNKQDLWKSCHTAINKSILISERKAAAAAAAGKTFVYGDTSLLNFSETVAANRQNMKTDDTNSNSDLNSSMEQHTAAARLKSKQTLKRKARKVKYSEGSDSDEDADDFCHMSADERHHDDGDDEFDDDDDDDNDDDDDTDTDDQTMSKLKASVLKRNGKKSTTAHSSSTTKQKSKKFKLNEHDNAATSTDESDDELEEEIELIQNNRSRHLTGKSADNQTVKDKDGKPKEESSEASAAANIAASMKKRYVVVAAPTDQAETNELTSEVTTNESVSVTKVSTTTPANKSTRQINRKISPPPKSTTSGRNISLSVPSASSSSTTTTTSTRQLPNRLKQVKETNNKPLVELVAIKQEPSSGGGGSGSSGEIVKTTSTTITTTTTTSDGEKQSSRVTTGKTLRSRHQTQPEVSTSRIGATTTAASGGQQAEERTTIVTRSRSTRKV